MLDRELLLASLASLLVLSIPLQAQEVELDDLRANINIFSGVLEEALDLNQSSGLFGISLGGVEATYLYGQGVVLEVNSPLASRRNRLSLASLNATMQSLPSRGNPFESMRRPESALATQPATALASTAQPAESFYQGMMDRIATIDYSLIVNTALQQAADSARALRNFGDLDAPGYDALRTEIDSLRNDMQARLTDLRSLEQRIRAADEPVEDSQAERAGGVSSEELRQQLDQLLERIEPLRDQALAKAADLMEQTEAAEQRFAQSWQEDLVQFENKLYVAMCDYGTTLRELPASENISVVLKGLGDETDSSDRADKVHVFSKVDVQQCQNGDIDVATLQQRAVQYSY